ncbi:MAG TPA: oxidoreductase [Armatimonadetes bacterium]|nr:oxidoreductase [Armatimonadota bacterium]
MVAWAVGDVFLDKAQGFGRRIDDEWGDKADIGDRMFGGFDNYKQVIDSDIDILVTAAPPGFRPMVIQYAVEKGKHVFMEKPVAVDAHGCNIMFEAARQADEKGLTIVAGTQRRYQANYQGTMSLIHAGGLGELTGGDFGWRGGGIWERGGRRKGERNNLQWQLENWYHFNWLCGDQIVEQHVHNLDVMLWCFQDQHPTSAYGVGYRVEGAAGRPSYSHMYSGMAVQFEFPNGARCMSWSGHGNIDGYWGERIVGTNGTSNCVDGLDLYSGVKVPRQDVQVAHGDPYVQEHWAMIDAIRNGRQINDTKAVTESTFMAVMGREACYSGKRVDWDSLLASDFSLMPDEDLLDLEADPDIPIPEIAVPGRYKLPEA